MPKLSHHMRLATAAAESSKDATKVGAVLVGANNEALIVTYNGPPIYMIDCEEIREPENKYYYSVHAEQNIVAFAARTGLKLDFQTVLTTHMPCANCMALMANAGIRRVVYGPGRFSVLELHKPYTERIARECGIRLDAFVDLGDEAY